MTEIFTNAPQAYDYHYVQTVEARVCPFTGHTVRRLQVAIGCDDKASRYQIPRYWSGLYWAGGSNFVADDSWPYKTPWSEMEVAR